MSTTFIERSELLDPEAYEGQRDEIRRRIRNLRDDRRVLLGDALTFLFENRETLLYQVQEKLRSNNLTADGDVGRELAAHNAMLADEGGAACSMLVSIEDETQRDEKLRQWLDLPQHVFLKLENGRHVGAEFDKRQVGEDKLSAVQYLKFPCGGVQPVGVVCTRPGLELFADLTPEQRRALADDMGIEVDDA